MKNILNYILVGIVGILVLSMAIKSCTAEEVCDVTGNQCQYESDCEPLLFSIVKSLF